MSTMASQITSLTIFYSTFYSKRRSKKTPKLRVTGLCAGNSPVTGEFPAQMASNAEKVSIRWRHHETSMFTDSCARSNDSETVMNIMDNGTALLALLALPKQGKTKVGVNISMDLQYIPISDSILW